MRRSHWLNVVALRLAVFLLAACTQGSRIARAELLPVAQAPTRETYLRLAEQMEAHLKDDVLAKWFPACVDKEHGGFHASFAHDWKRGGDTSRFLVFQGRMTWVSAQVAMRYPELNGTYKEYARHGAKFLSEIMWDKECGGLFWGLDAQGRVCPQFGDEKHAYGISFGIYGAAAAYEATQDAEALDLAKRTYAWLDQNAHDGANGGYHEALTRAGKPILAPPSPGKRQDGIGTLYGCKSMNTHIHLLEALTGLYRVWPDKQLQARLRELLTIVRDKIAVPPGCLNLYFTPDWRPLPDHDSFGHDVETAFLLLEAAEALKDADEARTLATARSLVDHALEYGWDSQYGGFYDKGAAFTPAYGLDKVWWTQAEGLNALLLMHEKFGQASPRYFEAFLKQWFFIWKYQADHQHGEWYETVSREGKPIPNQPKGQIWKAAYHNGRALLNVTAALRRLAGK